MKGEEESGIRGGNVTNERGSKGSEGREPITSIGSIRKPAS